MPIFHLVRNGSAVLAMLLLAIGQPESSVAAGAARPDAGFVYVMSNNPSGNAVLQYARSADGTLTPEDVEATGGLGGTGNGVGPIDPLGSQDSLILSDDGSVLLAVNAGSNDVSSLRADASGVTLVSRVASGGTFPASIARAGRLVYVLNVKGTPNVSGFTLSADGTLSALPGSSRPLPGGSAAKAHDIRFSPDGDRLLVTEDGTNQIDVFEIGAGGLIDGVSSFPSSGPGPFGFTFGRRGLLIVTEAAAGAVSSYQLGQDSARVITASEPNGQLAACWIALTREGHAFVSNTASATLSSYQVSASGRVNLVDAVAASTGPGSAPIDSALSSDDRFLYVIDSALGRVLVYRVDGHALASLGAVTGLPTTLQGIAAQ